jgi:hypothetical protein
MNAWAIAIVVLMFCSFTVQMVKHGERRPNYNGMLATLDLAISLFLFYKAGLFG